MIDPGRQPATAAIRAGVVAVVIAVAGTLPASGQAAEEVALGSFAFTPEQRAPADIVGALLPLLSEVGRVELHNAGRTLVVRDRPEKLMVVAALLRSLDRPARRVAVRIDVLKGWEPAVSGAPSPALPPELAKRLERVLPSRSYELVASVEVEADEGEAVRGLEVGALLALGFRIGSLLGVHRLQLQDVEIVSGRGDHARRVLSKAALNLWVGRPIALAVTDRAGQEAVVLVMQARLVAARSPEEDP